MSSSKKTENKHSISIFPPVSILNTFKEFSKDLLVSEIEIFLSPFLAAYRKSYNTQHVLKNDRRVEGKFR